MGAPETNQVMFCNPERNDLQWIIQLIKTFNTKWTFYNLPPYLEERLIECREASDAAEYFHESRVHLPTPLHFQ
eukprot:12937116-Prorocentrum_lima.AAC.1